MTTAPDPAGHLLFVCTGNTCRSPLAAAVALSRGVVATSAGIHPAASAPPTPEARAAATRVSLDIDAHRSREVNEPLIAAAGMVYTMTNAQADDLRRRWPEYAAKVDRLDPAADIDDPFGGDAAVYAATLAHIDRAIATRLGGRS